MVIDRAFWRGRRVFLTGHTGFKGAWACLLLNRLGAAVTGYALPPADGDLFAAARAAATLERHHLADIRDFHDLMAAMTAARPEIVLHMAAQSLVRASYADPVGTYATNVMGTVHVLEAVRRCPDVLATVVVTSDKCYENVGSVWGYRETDRFGGHDPYSSSKACAEIATDAWRRSFNALPGAVATARAGNVIGGGDWAADRIVPDAMRAFGHGVDLRVRNPHAVRPWQHVLDPLGGYLRLAERLAANGAAFAEGWNFGPSAASEVSVGELVTRLAAAWGESARWTVDAGEHPHEAAYLTLDCTKAARRLGWRPLLELDATLALTVEWYRGVHAGGDPGRAALAQIDSVLSPAKL